MFMLFPFFLFFPKGPCAKPLCLCYFSLWTERSWNLLGQILVRFSGSPQSRFQDLSPGATPGRGLGTWGLPWGALGTPWGFLCTTLSPLDTPLGTHFGPLGHLWGVLGKPWGAFW